MLTTPPIAFEPYNNEPGPRITSTRSISEATYVSGNECPKTPAHCGCPSNNINTLFPWPTPRIFTVPADPFETPNPVIPFSVTNNPGTRSDNTGNKADSLLASIWSRSITEIVRGTLFRFTCILFAEITTPCKLIRLSIPNGSIGSTGPEAKTAEPASSPEISKNPFFIIYSCIRFVICFPI